MIRRLFLVCLGIGLGYALAGCAPLPPERPGRAAQAAVASYEETTFASLPGWGRDSVGPSLRAFLVSCARPGLPGTLAAACGDARTLAPDNETAVRAFFERVFVPYRMLAEGRAAGLITGYYEPVIVGNRIRTARFAHPIYGVPGDLFIVDMASVYPELRELRLRGRVEGQRVLPYYSRTEIEARAEQIPARVIAWAEDPVEVFFLQVQGSGQVLFEDGTRIRVGFAEQNGHPYRSLGRYLVDVGELTLEQASMDGIKRWAAASPEKLKRALQSNASYVFFRELPANDGPIGALGAPLSAGRSLAVDRRYIPLGAPVFLRTTDPLSQEPLERLMVAQDTGGAIRGAVRADLYWGTGAEAGARAGRMRQEGGLWLLWPRGAPPPAP